MVLEDGDELRFVGGGYEVFLPEYAMGFYWEFMVLVLVLCGHLGCFGLFFGCGGGCHVMGERVWFLSWVVGRFSGGWTVVSIVRSSMSVLGVCTLGSMHFIF